nr:hypothetical protein [Acinetobacter baumannii]MBO0619149.1 hypothetical protein [Acinetobacter baumannii]MBO0672105.1 hypothetical protein [Acinetobacter baumannii]
MKALCIFALFLYVRGEVLFENKTADEYIDIVIEKAIEQIPHPLNLPDFETHSIKDIEFREGVAWGLDELQRVGFTNLIINDDSHTFEGRLGIDFLTARYKWISAKPFSRKIRSGFVFMQSSNFTIDIRVRQDHDPKAHAILEELKVIKMENIDVDITGMSYLTWLGSQIADILLNKFNEHMESFVESKLRTTLEKEFEHVRLPIIENGFF